MFYLLATTRVQLLHPIRESGLEEPASSEGFLIGCQVLLSPLVSLQGFDGVDILRKLGLPPHQDFLLLQVLQTLMGGRDR